MEEKLHLFLSTRGTHLPSFARSVLHAACERRNRECIERLFRSTQTIIDQITFLSLFWLLLLADVRKIIVEMISIIAIRFDFERIVKSFDMMENEFFPKTHCNIKRQTDQNAVRNPTQKWRAEFERGN